MLPREEPLGHPAVHTQAAAVLGSSLRQLRLEAPLAQGLTMRFGSVCPVRVEHLGLVLGFTEQLVKLREYRQALITAAVTGKLDVQQKTVV